MDTQKFTLATIAGAVVFFFAGYLIWGIALMNFHQSNLPDIPGLVKNPPDMVLIGLAMIVTAILYTLIFQRWAGIKTFKTGAIAGALLATLMGLGNELMQMSSTNMMTWPVILVDIIGNAVWGALGGG
ncbi:MAG: hypothetical protein KJP00_08020, partial [Bacteroidia bacterium]|nr:hypothetical protein [Bacteroidia bacterium]